MPLSYAFTRRLSSLLTDTVNSGKVVRCSGRKKDKPGRQLQLSADISRCLANPEGKTCHTRDANGDVHAIVPETRGEAFIGEIERTLRMRSFTDPTGFAKLNRLHQRPGATASGF